MLMKTLLIFACLALLGAKNAEAKSLKEDESLIVSSSDEYKLDVYNQINGMIQGGLDRKQPIISKIPQSASVIEPQEQQSLSEPIFVNGSIETILNNGLSADEYKLHVHNEIKGMIQGALDRKQPIISKIPQSEFIVKPQEQQSLSEQIFVNGSNETIPNQNLSTQPRDNKEHVSKTIEDYIVNGLSKSGKITKTLSMSMKPRFKDVRPDKFQELGQAITKPMPTMTKPMPTMTQQMPTMTQPMPTMTQPMPTMTQPMPAMAQPSRNTYAIPPKYNPMSHYKLDWRKNLRYQRPSLKDKTKYKMPYAKPIQMKDYTRNFGGMFRITSNKNGIIA